MDHAVLLQTERGLENLTDRVERLQEKFETDECDCSCGVEEFEEQDKRLRVLSEEVQDLRKDLTAARERITKLQQMLVELLS